MTDLYETLGVARDASPADVKKAYRRMAAKTHPDVGGDVEKFKAVALAHRVLSDDEQRKRYDETGKVEDDANPIESHAITLITGMIEHLLADEQAVHKDLIREMRQTLAQQLSQTQAEQRKGEAYLKRTEKMQGRFKGGRGAALLDRMVAKRIDQVKGALGQMTHQVAVVNAALALLSDVSFDFEKMASADASTWNSAAAPFIRSSNFFRGGFGGSTT